MPHGYPHMPFGDFIRMMVLYLVGVVATFLLGRILHEATHWLVAWILGADVERVSVRPLRGGSVLYGFDSTPDAWKPLLINASPQIIGVFILLPYTAWLWIETADLLLVFIFLVFFAGYSLLGSISDVAPQPVRERHQTLNLTDYQKGMTVAGGMAVWGIIALQITPFAWWVSELGYWLVGGGMMIALLLTMDQDPEGWAQD